MTEEKKQRVERFARGVVARGRTVQVPHPTEKKVVGQNPVTGQAIMGPTMREFGPGEEVTLQEKEIVNLRAQGFLVDPGKIIPDNNLAEGSHYKETMS